VAEIRKTLELAFAIVVETPTIESMAKCMVRHAHPSRDHCFEVAGLTIGFKIFLSTVILLPRFLLTCYLTWLGSRFLAAAGDFSGVVNNVVALSFVLALKDLLYFSLVPARAHRETVHTLLRPANEKEPPTCPVYLGAFAWGLVTLGYVVLYMYVMQHVLPGYKWDVHAVCQDWLTAHLS